MKGFASVPSVAGFMLAMLASVAPDAQAVNSQRALRANATSYCQAALPVFDGQVRKRPLAVQNEGVSNAFITCSFTHHANASAAEGIGMFAHNHGDSAQDLTCTLVTGYATGGNQYIPKTVNLLPGGAQESLGWLPEDFTGGVVPDGPYSLSCNLLPGVGLNDSVLGFEEDVGA